MTGPIEQVTAGSFSVEPEWIDMVESLPVLTTLIDQIVVKAPVRKDHQVPIEQIDDKHLIWLYGALVGQVALLMGRTIDHEYADEHVSAICQLLVNRERERKANPEQVIELSYDNWDPGMHGKGELHVVSSEKDDERPLKDGGDKCEHTFIEEAEERFCSLDRGHEGPHT